MQAVRSLSVVVAALLAARGAHAREPSGRAESPVNLAWSAPRGCPDGARVQADVSSLVGELPRSVPLEAEGLVTLIESGVWTLRLSAGSGSARVTRELSAPSCDELAKAAATLLAIAVSPSPSEPVEPPSAPAPERGSAGPSTEHIVATSAERPQLPEWQARSSPPFAVAALAGGSAGAVGIAPGVAGALAWLPRWGRVEVFGFWSPIQRIDASDGIAGRFALWAVGARGCRMLGEGRLGIGPCGGIEGGQVSATGSGANVVDPTTERRTWAAANAGGLLTLQGGPFALRLQVDVVAPLFRERFTVDGAEPVHRPSALGGRLLSGVELRFP